MIRHALSLKPGGAIVLRPMIALDRSSPGDVSSPLSKPYSLHRDHLNEPTTRLRVPLTPMLALFIEPGASGPATIASVDGRDHEIKNLNYETAARSTRWLIGASEAALEASVRQVRG